MHRPPTALLHIKKGLEFSERTVRATGLTPINVQRTRNSDERGAAASSMW